MKYLLTSFWLFKKPHKIICCLSLLIRNYGCFRPSKQKNTHRRLILYYNVSQYLDYEFWFPLVLPCKYTNYKIMLNRLITIPISTCLVLTYSVLMYDLKLERKLSEGLLNHVKDQGFIEHWVDCVMFSRRLLFLQPLGGAKYRHLDVGICGIVHENRQKSRCHLS